ncbi:hypothetical protein A1395_22260 [Pseudomonas protegens]|uniref:hypothetical protein n=1 Tax=Pseudomonas protegens TaxID=380021 RepID=UPI000C9B5928|nr:hypothetical protein [Pseudomonas protegens]PNG32232.1 hypothetical protein A1395_22260 [Pseudomonas protegens]
MPQIERSASIIYGDANIVIREPHPGRQPWEQEKAWERDYRNQVLKRIVQTLNRLGWTCAMPELRERDKRDQYGIAENFRRNKRVCSKGDLKADLELSGATITFQMFQNVNAPDRPDHDGRYQGEKEKHMPYLMRLEMERTRRRIRAYLCNVFSGYYFDEEWMHKHERKVGPGHLTAIERIQLHYENSWHFKGADWDKYKSGSWMGNNVKSADGKMLEHGQTVWFTDYEGRWQRGTALYNINNMWWVVTGPFSYTNECCRELYTTPPEHPRVKENQERRRSRLESLMSQAAKKLDFKRAEVLKNILFPPNESLFMIWTDRHGGAYFGPGYSGYTNDTNQAGKYTRAELKPYLGDADEKEHLRAIPVRKAA